MELNEYMVKILNKRLNFCVVPQKVNITELLGDNEKFDRRMKWKEVFKDEEPNENWKPDLFPIQKEQFQQMSVNPSKTSAIA